jgi:serine phosphatase RsbU (regulator of sigma subunit)
VFGSPPSALAGWEAAGPAEIGAGCPARWRREVTVVTLDHLTGSATISGDGGSAGRRGEVRVGQERDGSDGAPESTGYVPQPEQDKESAFMAKSAQILAEASSFEDTLDRLARLSLAAMGDICIIDVVDDQGEIARMVARHRDPAQQPLVDRLTHHYAPDPEGQHPVIDVIATGRTSWSHEMSDDFLRQTTRDSDHFALVKQLGFRSYLIVPLLTAGEILGSVSIVSSSRSFEEEDVSFAERLAEQVAAVVYNARRYDATLRTAHILQRSLLPRSLPHLPGLEVDTRYLPGTRGLEVGGDFYDLVVLPSGRAGFMIGDVAGHDQDAAALMGQLRSAARALAGRVHSPASLIEALQWSWDLLGFDRIATALMGRLDQKTGDLILASAGHHPPLLLTPEGGRYLPVVPSAPLGAPAGAAANWEGHLHQGHTLLLYTDGVLEDRTSESGASMARLAYVGAAGDLHPTAVCERVVSALPANRSDDVALLALRISGPLPPSVPER